MAKFTQQQRLAGMAMVAASILPLKAAALDNRLLPAPVMAQPAKLQAEAVQVEKDEPRAALIPFEQPASALKLVGEDATLRLSFSISDRQRIGGGALQLAYTNAVSVLPEDAVLQVTVNGKAAGSFAIRSPVGSRIETIALAPDMLQTGRNHVELRAIQHHRVDCSLAATYELWTRLSPEKSGFLASSPLRFDAPMDLLSVARDAKGVTDIRVVAPVGGNPALVNQAMSAVQSLSLALNRQDVAVTVAPEPGKGPGIDLYVGDAGQPGQPDAARIQLSRSAPGFSLAPSAEVGRAVVVIRGRSRQELDAALLAVLRGPLAPALQTGVLSPHSGTLHAAPGSTFTLADTGYTSRPFAGRLARTSFDLTMPADFYPADYDTMNFYLSGATAPGLLPSSQFLIRVNDRVVTSLPLRDTDGQTLAEKHIEMPLRALRPGLNRVELLAEVPTPADATCLPEERTEDKPRFMMLDQSRLEVPNLARIGRLPDLGAFSGAAYPYQRGQPFGIVISTPTAGSLSVAATTMTRLALAAGRPVDGIIRFGAPDTQAKGDLIQILVGPDQGRAKPAPDAAPSGVDAFTTSATGLSEEAAAAGSEQLLDAFRQTTWRGGERSLNARLQDWLGQVSNRFNSWLRYRDASDTPLPKGEDTLLQISQAPAPSGEGVWTTFRAANEKDLTRGFSSLAEPETWKRLEGGSAVIRASDLALLTEKSDRRFIREITDESLGNFRRLAASWFSDNFQIYVLLVVCLFSLFGFWLGVVVPHKGVKS